jgi:hypothetical protein
MQLSPHIIVILIAIADVHHPKKNPSRHSYLHIEDKQDTIHPSNREQSGNRKQPACHASLLASLPASLPPRLPACQPASVFLQALSVKSFPSSIFRQAFSVKRCPSSVFRQAFSVKRFPPSVVRQAFSAQSNDLGAMLFSGAEGEATGKPQSVKQREATKGAEAQSEATRKPHTGSHGKQRKTLANNQEHSSNRETTRTSGQPRLRRRVKSKLTSHRAFAKSTSAKKTRQAC